MIIYRFLYGNNQNHLFKNHKYDWCVRKTLEARNTIPLIDLLYSQELSKYWVRVKMMMVVIAL